MTTPSLVPGDITIVGRQREAALLWEGIQSAERGRLAVAWLAGEPGIGKTRLLDAVASRALDAGMVVRRGGAFDAEGMPPYLPFLEALGQHVRATSPDDLRAQVGPFASVLATILLEVPARLGATPAAYSLPPDQARLRLYEAVASLLAAIADERPLVLILDDLQWADPASLDLLRYVARRQQTSRLCILGAYRTGEVAHRPEFERTLAALENLRVLRPIAVETLSRDDVSAMAALALRGPVDENVSAELHLQSEGNPFFAEELLREWQATAAIVCQGGVWVRAASPPQATGSPPPSIARVIRQRLARLSSETLSLLRTAAIIGRTFDVSLLAEASGSLPEDVEGCLRDALAAQLVRAGPANSFSFTHDMLRECLYEDVTATRRQRLHGFIGLALERRPEPVDTQRLAELAFHFARSGDRERGARYARQAAARALDTLAFAEAMTGFQTALRLTAEGDSARGELLLGLGDAAVLAGAEAEAAVAFAQAQAWFQSRGEVALAARAAHALGHSWWRQEEIARARTAFEAARALLEPRSGPALVRLLVDLGTLLAVSAHEHAAGIALVQRAVDQARDLDDRQLLAASNRALGNLLVRGNDLAAGIPLLEEALALAVAVDDAVEAAECCACLALGYFWQGAVARSEAAALQRLAFAEASHDRYQLRHVYTWLAVCSAMRGQFAEAERRLDQAQAVVAGLESPEPRAYLAFTRGAMAVMRGDYAAADAYLGQAIAIFRAIGSHALVWYLGFVGVLQLALGQTEAARQSLRELRTFLDALPENVMAGAELLACAAQIALSLGDLEQLESLLPRLTAHRGQFHDLLIDRLLGEAATRRGAFGEAALSLACAESLARREGLVWELAHVLEAQADLERATAEDGEAERARLAEALALVEGWGNEQEAARLGERIALIGARRPARYPAGLSGREAEVLHLVAQGRSNRQIAAALSLSVKTIENHLTSVYGKLGVDNRAAATAFAVRHDLA